VWRDRELVGARSGPRDNKSPNTLVDAIRSMVLDGEFDPPPSPQDEEVARGRPQMDAARLRKRGTAAPERGIQDELVRRRAYRTTRRDRCLIPSDVSVRRCAATR